MKLTENEVLLTDSKSAEVILTNKRLIRVIEQGGNKQIVSIQLNKITAIEKQLYYNYILIILAFFLGAISSIFAYVTEINFMYYLGSAVAIILFFVFLFTKEEYIVVETPTAKITLRKENLSKVDAIDILEKLDNAVTNSNS